MADYLTNEMNLKSLKFHPVPYFLAPASVGKLTALALSLFVVEVAYGAQTHKHTFAHDPGLKVPIGFHPITGWWRVQPYGNASSLQHVLGQVSTTADRPRIMRNQPIRKLRQVSVLIKVDGGSEQVAGIVLDATNDRVLQCEVDFKQNELRYVLLTGNRRQVLCRTGATANRLRWQRLVIQARSNGYLAATLNKKSELLLKAQPRSEWWIGMFTATGTIAYFDDFTYTGELD